MIVKDLIKELEKCDPEAEVVLQSDPEGNGYWRMDYRPENAIWEGTYWEGEMWEKELTEELKKEGYDESDVLAVGERRRAVSAVCLMPW